LGLGGYPYLKRVEIAGRALHRRVRNAARGRSLSMESNGEDDVRVASKLKEEAILAKYRKSIKGKQFLQLNMYQQLGLTDVMFDATPEQIKKAYHRVLIEHHPDKTLKDENDPNYLAVQRAFSTLMDKQRKRAYDSQCEFDEWIPTGTEKIKQNMDGDKTSSSNVVDFYALYGPVFERNARFSEKQPVPMLGDDDTPLDDVHAFYNFWHTFESWRDFTHNAEHDVESVENRDEKRFMMKKNEAAAKKQKKKEYSRLADLVDRAKANDPRLRRVKAAAKAKKENERKAKEAAAQAIIDAQKKAEEEAARIAAEKEEKEKATKANAKLEREKMKKAFRKVKKVFRELMDAIQDGRVDTEETEFLCETIEMNTMEALVDALGGSVDNLKASAIEKVVTLLTELRGEAYMKKKAAKRS
jgi:DnaJ family protein C protein 2